MSHRTAEENLGIAYLASVLRKDGFFVKIIDGWLLDLDYKDLANKILNEPKPIFIGFSCYQSNMQMALKTIEEIKSKRKNDVFAAGGFGPTFNPNDFLNAGFNFVMRGEGEDSIRILAKALQKNQKDFSKIPNISYIKNKKILNNPILPIKEELDKLPFPARDTVLYALNKKTPIHLLTARGCTGFCLFCSINSFFNLSKTKKWRQRNIENIINELEELKNLNVKHLKVIDDSFIDGDRNEIWCKKFFNEIKKRKLNFLFRASIRAEKVTNNNLFYLSKAGFFSFSCGIENFSKTALKRMNKGASLSDNLKALDLFKKYKIYVQAGQILFDPYTTIEELKENYKYMKKYDWIISKGIFTEMFAAEGTLFTKKINQQALKISNEHKIGNYKYEIVNNKTSIAYKGLKKWHTEHMYIYDKAIDPLTSPKALEKQELKLFYSIYKKIRVKDLNIMNNVLKLIDKNKNLKEVLKYIDIEINKNKKIFANIDKKTDVAYKKCNLIYKAEINPFFSEDNKVYNEYEHYELQGPTDEFGDIKSTKSSIKNIGWTLGNFCPFKCKHCYSMSARVKGANLSKKIIDRIIDQLKKNNVKTVNLGGNEPIYTNGKNINDTMLPYIVRKLKAQNIEVGLTTSGITLLYLYKNHKDIFKLINDFDISLDSPFEKEHNENRGANLYKSAIECLKICQKENKPHSVIMAGMKWNFTKKHLKALVKLCKKYDANVRINTLKPLNKDHYKQILTPKQFYKNFSYLMSLCNSVDIGESVLRIKTKLNNKKRCPCGISSFRIHSITPKGEIHISPCVYLHDYKSKQDLLKTDLKNIINSDEFLVFRKRNKNPQMIKGCDNCKLLNVCGGGCVARSYLHHAIQKNEKSLIQKDPYCPIDINDTSVFPVISKIKTKQQLVHMNYLCTWIGKPL